jgi:hypothetical protein
MLQVGHDLFPLGYFLADFAILFTFNWFLNVFELKLVHVRELFFRVVRDVLEDAFLALRRDAFHVVIKISAGWDQLPCILHYVLMLELWRILDSPGLIRVRQEPAAWIPIAMHLWFGQTVFLFYLLLHDNELLSRFDFVQASEIPICNRCQRNSLHQLWLM